MKSVSTEGSPVEGDVVNGMPVRGIGYQLSDHLDRALWLPEGSEMERCWKAAKLCEVLPEITKLLKALAKKGDEPSLPLGE